MILRRWALTCCFLAAMAPSSNVRAGAWGMDPVVGVLGDYSSNPALLHQPDTTVTSGSLQLDAPATYEDGRFKFLVLPSFRVGDSAGFTAVTSDYEHLNVKGEFDTDRTTFSAGGGIARDSSLAYDYLTSNDVGVRRDSTSADVNWDRHLTELIKFDADASWQRVLFGETVGAAPLTDYKYVSISPALSWNLSERGKLTLTGSVGRYDSLDSHDASGFPTSTESRSGSLQFGFVGQLSELWALTALGGYSRALDQSDASQLECVEFFVLGSEEICLAYELSPAHTESSQNGSVYTLNLSRQGSQVLLNATASRQLTPTGYAYLSRQDIYELKASYGLSERWSFSGDARAVQYQNPPLSGAADETHVRYFALTANWGWTERWNVALTVARIFETVSGRDYNVGSNEVTLTLSRQFDHITFQ